jgi:hypothetical protein
MPASDSALSIDITDRAMPASVRMVPGVYDAYPAALATAG